MEGLIISLKKHAMISADNLNYHGGGFRKEEMIEWKAAVRLEYLLDLLDQVWRCHNEWDEGAYYVTKIPNALHDKIHNVCFPPDNEVKP